MISPDDLMRLAIDKARTGIDQGQTPFGCAIARGDRLLSVAHNSVWASTDITAHAEIVALREACRNTGSVLLPRAFVATTCEPCPMCMAALHWARVETVYFGAGIPDARQAGFNELSLSAEQLLRQGHSDVRLVPDLMRDECRELFASWDRRTGHRPY